MEILSIPTLHREEERDHELLLFNFVDDKVIAEVEKCLLRGLELVSFLMK